MTEINTFNNEIYTDIQSHLLLLKNRNILSDDVISMMQKVLEDIYISINESTESQDEDREKLKEIVCNIGCSSLSLLLKLLTDDSELFDKQFHWLNKYFKFYKVHKEELILSPKEPTIEFLKNDDRLLCRSFIYHYNTCILKIINNGHELTLHGFMEYEQNPIYNESYYREKYDNIFTENHNLTELNEQFRHNYLTNCSNIDFVLLSEQTIFQNMTTDYNLYKSFINNTTEERIEKFMSMDSKKQRQIIMLCLLDEKTYVLANSLFEYYLSFPQQELRYTLFWNLRKQLKEVQSYSKVEKEKIMGTHNTLPLEEQIILLNTSSHNKSRALAKLKELTGSRDVAAKAEHYLQAFCKIPFGIYKKEEIFIQSEKFNEDYKALKEKVKVLYDINLKEHYDKAEIDNLLTESREDSKKHFYDIKDKYDDMKRRKKEYLLNVKQKLDDIVYGQDLIKQQIKLLFSQWLSGTMDGSVIGIFGPPGTGKTDIIKNGISKCLVDDQGNSRPFIFIPLGGSKDSAEFKGHSYTYQSSQWGTLVQGLMDAKCMNPIFFFDELDKVSGQLGTDVINFLIHVIDPTQNSEISDKFFTGVKIDYSKVLIFFTYNDPSFLSNILRDRITELKVKPLTKDDKINIITNFTAPKLCKEIGINDILISRDHLSYIIDNYTMEPGIRKLIERVKEILRYINMCDINDEEWTLDKEFIDKVLERFNKPKYTKIFNEPRIGVVNALYATASGLGGIITMQAQRCFGKENLELKLSGRLGEVMKESVDCAKTVAWNLLTVEEKENIYKDYNESNDKTIHIHCPDGAVDKDGPSAGITLTLLLYSFLSHKKIDNELAMTGEIDILGNVKAIGGIESKLSGAIMAGCKRALLPLENVEDYNKIDENIRKGITVIFVSHIKEVIRESLV